MGKSSQLTKMNAELTNMRPELKSNPIGRQKAWQVFCVPGETCQYPGMGISKIPAGLEN